MAPRPKLTPENLNQNIAGLPRHLGLVVKEIGTDAIETELVIAEHHLAPLNGFLHAGSVITLADTSCGIGCFSNLPDDAVSFTTIELKSNFLSTAREGTLQCTAKAAHLGRSTQVWDATVSHVESGKTIALFRCTQFILYSKS